MKIYDSLTNKVFELSNKNVSIYNCGPTVYNDIHIGNARPLITFDVLQRFLKFLRFNVFYVHNITDIDDKIINQAKILKKTESEVANTYFEHYLEICNKLNILSPQQMPKVSQNILGMIEYIQKLINVHAAYVTNKGDVYFDVKNIPIYGILSHQNIEQLQEGVRKELSNDKKSPLDFVLWKKTETGLNWKSPWSVGRPGWHTECALFINKFIGDHTTIHGGGIDLKFPHHENENAQNYALFKRNIADIWMHVGHISVNEQKMAKSLGNFVLVKDLLKQYSGNDIRWFMYQSRYQNPLSYSEKLFAQSSNELWKLLEQINQGYVQAYLHKFKLINSVGVPEKDFIATLNNDLEFPNVKTIILKQVKNLANFVRAKKFDKFQKLLATIKGEFNILGIVYNNPLDNQEIKSLVDEWQKSLQQKNYLLADKYRQQLIDKKVI